MVGKGRQACKQRPRMELEENVGENDSTTPALELTEEQKKRIESNKEKAKALRKKRLQQKPYDRPATSDSPTATRTKVSAGKPAPSHVIPPSQWDTYGGYILEDDQPHHSHGGKTVEEDGEPCVHILGMHYASDIGSFPPPL